MAPSRRYPQARRAYQKGDVSATVAAHSVQAEEKHQHEHGQYLKSARLRRARRHRDHVCRRRRRGGAQLSTGVVLILGFANLVADGLSMAVGDYLSTKAELEYQRAERRREQWEVENYPEGEKRELVELYVEKGMPEDDAKTIAEIMSRHKETWIEVMMVEELGIVASGESPIKNAVVTFFSFAIFGLVPLAAFIAVLLVPLVKFDAFTVAGLLTAITLFALGAIKVRITGKNWFKSGLETLLVGGLAAAAAYAVGRLLGGLA